MLNWAFILAVNSFWNASLLFINYYLITNLERWLTFSTAHYKCDLIIAIKHIAFLGVVKMYLKRRVTWFNILASVIFYLAFDICLALSGIWQVLMLGMLHIYLYCLSYQPQTDVICCPSADVYVTVNIYSTEVKLKHTVHSRHLLWLSEVSCVSLTASAFLSVHTELPESHTVLLLFQASSPDAAVTETPL